MDDKPYYELMFCWSLNRRGKKAKYQFYVLKWFRMGWVRIDCCPVSLYFVSWGTHEFMEFYSRLNTTLRKDVFCKHFDVEGWASASPVMRGCLLYFMPPTSWKTVGSYFEGKLFLRTDGSDLTRMNWPILPTKNCFPILVKSKICSYKWFPFLPNLW